MSYQRGSLKQEKRKEGMTWLLRYRVNSPNGERVENNLPIGLVLDFPTKGDAWREADRLGLGNRINSEEYGGGPIKFAVLAEFYLKTDYGEDAGRPKSDTSIPIAEHYVRDYLVARWGKEIAERIKTIEIQRWLKSLHEEQGLKWTTVAKIRSLMTRVFAVGIIHEKVTKNPVVAVEISTTSEYEAILITPPQTVAILGILGNNLLHFTLVLSCAATALRASEIVALRWSDIRWDEGRIRISKRWAKGKDGKPKTEASDDYVPMHPVLAVSLNDWRKQSPYSKSTDFVFPSFKCNGKVPLSPSTFVADHLRPAAKLAGVVIADGDRFGLHNLRHSLSNWLVNKRKENPKTVQGMLRHGRIQTTLDLYAQSDLDEMQKAQGAFLSEMGFATGMVQ